MARTDTDGVGKVARALLPKTDAGFMAAAEITTARLRLCADLDAEIEKTSVRGARLRAEGDEVADVGLGTDQRLGLF